MSATGLYFLICKVRTPTTVVTGKNHVVEVVFPAGTYVYVGSGGTNVMRRVMRHLSRNKPTRWNIDRLTMHPDVVVAGPIVFPGAGRHRECELSQRVRKLVHGVMIAKRFGSHDCRVCTTHFWRCGVSVVGEQLARKLRFGWWVEVPATGAANAGEREPS